MVNYKGLWGYGIMGVRSRVKHKYLLLTEFEGRTVSYGPRFFPFAYGPSAKRAGHKLTGKNEDP